MNTHQQTTNEAHVTARELFGEHVSSFRQYLVGHNYVTNTVQQYMRCVGALAATMKADGIAVGELNEALVLDLVDRQGWPEGRHYYAVTIAKRFVRFLHDRGVGQLPPPPTEKEIARKELRKEYESYLRRQRGLSESTIFGCWHQANRFLEYRFGEEAGDLSKITATDIIDFLQHVTGRKPPVRNKTVSTPLRSFFRFLFQTKRNGANLAKGIPSVAQCYGKRLPVHLTSEQTEVLVDAVRGNKPTSRRNHAMVLLLARLGLRPQEVIRIQVDDIDWRAGEIVIRGKGGRHDRLPLPTDVGEAIVEYIRNDRVTESRTLFVSNHAPHKPFKNAEVLNTVLVKAFAKSGLTPPIPYTCTHILRHSLATNLVRQGASLDEVSNLLRHRSQTTTMLYARMDVDGLRSIALPWPGEGGAQ
ncbi:Tyrosine recombinase XerD [Pontiella desulfatans]|uniref:Tyrosine recombinase XerD n=1 Tax=Pontiella desulfatans TaxID=2750659 RepID=A0A6C2U286_PONDE|nr:site-specific integrase [Pontiella desulfatans]VGO14098.1 Tyrosine recombinase XerD [Pontiella desulfatans]